ncbi:LCP family protein [uncultured Clostridium sp.]|uniref:LCP family protein n=1 Tax=uncultured Clostridium sp. TaxID=59620 RepID=UPI0025E9570E|nr:LCP family protein [uncultured Clostridium sp.]MDU4884531.1 LCP family protein [Clostridium celatum]MDU7077700.1 LCP family protein [Clostridium celatum]
MTKGKKITVWILAIVLVIILGAVGGVYFYGNHLFNKLEKVEIDKDNIGITEEVEEKLSQYSNSIINIALFGVDAVEGGAGRSDSIMIATLDTVNKKLKLTSIMRDSYVAIDGHGNDKINHAYAFGGPQLAIKTLNENFDLNIEDFASVNFETLPKIIDKIGGIELDIDEDELKYINSYIANLNSINGTNEPSIASAGLQHVSGTQALAFCRIRYTSGGDYKRTERHREVLTKILEKIETLPATSYPSLLSDILPMVNTSLDYSEILELGTEVLKLGDSKMELERFPLDDYCEGKMINEIYYLTFDKETTVNQLHNYIFEDKITWQ